MRTALFAAFLVLLPQGLRAQETPRFTPEERIRIVAPGAGYEDPVAGTVVDVRGDTLLLQLGTARAPGVQVSIPVETIERLERSTGQGSRVKGGAYGLALGTAAGALAGRLHYRMQTVYIDSERNETGRESLHTELTLAGAALGVVVGAMLPGEGWRRAWVPGSVAVDAAPRGGTSLGLRLTF